MFKPSAVIYWRKTTLTPRLCESQRNISATIEWDASEFGADTLGHERMNPDDFDDP